MILQDNDLIFDKETLRYYLTEEYVFNTIGDLSVIAIDEFDPNPSSLPERVIKRACDMLYDFIEIESIDSISSLYFLTHSKKALNCLKRALCLQLEYLCQVGDTANSVGMKRKDRVHNGAVDLLAKLGIFNVRINGIPKNVENW